MIVTSAFMVLFLPALAATNDSAVEKSVTMAFTEYQKAQISGNHEKAWNCMGNKRLTYDIFMTSGLVRATQERESLTEYWDSLLALEIKISEGKATADLGQKKTVKL